MIFFCEMTLAAGFATAAAKPIRKEYLNIASKSIASKSLCFRDELTWDSVTSGVFDPSPVSALTTYEEIDAVCSDLSNYEEGDVLLGSKAIDELKALLRDAEIAHNAPIRAGHVIPCFGDLSIAWHFLERMLMITAFSDARSPRLDYGSTPPTAMGRYAADAAATGEKLADRLAWLYGDAR